MRLPLAAVALLLVSAAAARAQTVVPYNQRVQWAAPPVAIDSSSIQLRVVDVETGRAVPALLCFRSGTEVVTDTSGEVRVSGLRRTNTPAVVLAGRYAQTSLIFYPGKLGRSFATVRLVASDTSSETPTCRDAKYSLTD